MTALGPRMTGGVWWLIIYISGAKSSHMDSPEKQKLEHELERQIRHHRRWGRWDFGIAHLTTWIAIVASVVSALAIKLDWWGLTWCAILSGVPAFVVVVESRFNHMGRSKWHDRYVVKLERLLRLLRYAGEHESEVTKQWNKVAEEMLDGSPSVSFPTVEKSATK